MSSVALVWFRRDLRLTDHAALNAALASGAAVLPVFVLDPALLASARVGPARVRFLLEGLRVLDSDLRARGGRLLVLAGRPDLVLAQLARECLAAAVFVHRDNSPYARSRDERVAQALPCPLIAFDDVALRPPGAVLKRDGTPYLMYTPFRNAWCALPDPPLPEPPARGVFAPLLDAPPIPSDAELGVSEDTLLPAAGEQAASALLDAFLGGAVYDYAARRDELAESAPPVTSRLSAYLRFGMLSPRRAYWAARAALDSAPDEAGQESVQRWLDEVIWRDFFIHLLHHFPHTTGESFRAREGNIAWRDAPDDFAAWQAGCTGYPIVDAAMRQLAATGWIPNRARMIAASFLVKHLLIDWRRGEAHFMRLLLDGDVAANVGNWQWVAGTGVDAQPFFRIFNPVTQSVRYDPAGESIRRWVPELAEVRAPGLHAPWTLSPPPADYPPPIISHEAARERALAARVAL